MDFNVNMCAMITVECCVTIEAGIVAYGQFLGIPCGKLLECMRKLIKSIVK